MELGTDFIADQEGDTILVLGVNGFAGRANLNVNSEFGSGRVKSDAFGLGLAGTWYWPDGLFVDLQGRYSLFRTDLSSDVLGTLEENNAGSGYAVAGEIGKRYSDIPGAPNWSVTPFTGLTYSRARFDEFEGPNGEQVAPINEGQLRLNVGSLVERDFAPARADHSSRVYGLIDLSYDFLDSPGAEVGGYGLVSEVDPLWGEITLGATRSWGDGKYAVFGEVAYAAAIASNERQDQVRASVGLETRW